MKEKAEEIKKLLIEALQRIPNKEWSSFKLVIDFPPFSNRGYNTSPYFWNRNGDTLTIFPNFDNEFKTAFFPLLKK